MSISTATGARNREAYTIIFKDKQHKDFYRDFLPRCRCQDVYHKALVYCLGLSGDTRAFVRQIYDFETGDVKPKCLQADWQTSGSGRIIRMAFNLYCNGMPSVYDYEQSEEQLKECRCYTVEDLFCCEYAVYFWEAVKLRYPEYTRKRLKGLEGQDA